MASCAACLQPILRAQRFVLDGTEVFHAACIGQSYRSKLKISEQRARELEAQLADTRRAAARVEAEASRLRNEVTSRGAEVISLTGMLSGARQQLFTAQDARVALQDELQVARSQNAALRAELAAVKQERVTEPQGEDQDASVQRFKMLELD